MTLVSLALSASLALAPNDPITLELLGGEEIQGRVARMESDGIHVATADGRVFVRLAVLSQAEIAGEWVSPDVLQRQLQDRISWELAQLPEIGAVPHPFSVATASFLIPGSGQAMLGEKSEARSFFIADLVLLGLGSYLWIVQDDRPAAVPLFALDLIFRSASSSQAFDSSRRRRALLEKSEALSTSISP